jgi:hypothetical protein
MPIKIVPKEDKKDLCEARSKFLKDYVRVSRRKSNTTKVREEAVEKSKMAMAAYGGSVKSSAC